MKFSLAIATLALTALAVEVPEGSNPNDLLDQTLQGYGLNADQFLTEETLFSMGYDLGLRAAEFDENFVPVGADGKPAEKLLETVSDGYAFGIEARELAAPPPPSLVREASKNGSLKNGAMSAWVKTIDLKTTSRLAHAVNIGSGKEARTVPAGTPVDIIRQAFDKDGVPHIIVAYDGVALLIPTPDSDPAVVSGDTVIAKAQKAKAPRKQKEGGSAPKAPAERGPTLKGVIVDVMEGKDGGPGPLQTNGQFAARVHQLAKERGIGDKAQTFMQKSDRHVPYYMNCYGPDKNGHMNRLDVEHPSVATIAKIEARKYFLRAEGDEAAKLAAIPAELSAKFSSTETLTATERPAEAKEAKPEEPAADAAAAPAEKPAKKGKKAKDAPTAEAK